MNTKTNKKVGMIRKGAVVPFLIILGLVIIFNILFLDTSIKKSAEYFGGKINGAEVNIGEVKTSFKDLSLTIKDIAFTNTNDPSSNLFQIGQIKFQLLWDALLRAKFVIDESSMTDIKINGKRKSPGKVYPKPLEDPALKSTAKQTMANAKEEFKGNVFGDVSAIMSGDNSKDVLKNMEGELKSKQFYEDLEKQVDQKEEELKQMLANLPKGAEISQFDDRFKSINWNYLKDFKKAPGILKEASALRKDVSETIKKYDQAKDKVENEIKFLKDSTKQAQRLIDEDIKNLENKMSLPNLDSESIARVLFGAEFVDSLAKYTEYFEKAKEYMPPKKDKVATSVKPIRGSGRNYQFGTPKSYPLFWLKLSNISSNNSQGTVTGKIENFTSNQRIVNKPSTINLKADFPSQNLRGLEGNLIFDHRNGVNDKIAFAIDAFPVPSKTLSKSESASMVMVKSTGATKVDVSLVQDQVNMNMSSVFTDIDYQVSAKSKQVEQLLQSVAKEATRVTLDAKAAGTTSKLSFKIKTNLAELIKIALKKELEAKVKEAKDKIRAKVDEQIGDKKAKAQEKIDQLKSKYQGEIDKQKEKISALTGKIDEKKDSSKDAVQDKAKDALKSLKKKFKF
tara:strand:+ start:1833 stop:3698 length:1866 start_codon:yes stop_codon:yes gene_type:complete